MVSLMVFLALGICLVAIGFFVVTIFSLQDMLDSNRKTEDRLRQSEEWLRAIIDNTNALVSVKKHDGTYVMVNRGFERALGVSGLMVVGRRDDELFDATAAEALSRDDATVLQTNDHVEFDQTITTTANARDYFVVKAPLHDALGDISGVCTVATDITEHELARRERIRLFELSLDMMSIANFNGYITCVNPEFLRVTGYTLEELTSRPGMEFVHPDDRGPALAALGSLRVGQPLVNFESRFLCKDGRYKRLVWRVMPAVEEGMVYAVGREAERSIRTEHPRMLPGRRVA